MSSSFEASLEKATAKYLNMSLDEKRSQYLRKSRYVILQNIPTWREYSEKLSSVQSSSEYSKCEELNQKVSVCRGDITALEIDAIVNASDNYLMGGSGVDRAIHRAAGPILLSECLLLRGCPTGEAKITGGYKLPAKYVIHTVGPTAEIPVLLKKCYFNSLTVAKEMGLRTVAFPCISTGTYGYPNSHAAHVALKTVRDFLDENKSFFDRRFIFSIVVFNKVSSEVPTRTMANLHGSSLPGGEEGLLEELGPYLNYTIGKSFLSYSLLAGAQSSNFQLRPTSIQGLNPSQLLVSLTKMNAMRKMEAKAIYKRRS